MSCLFYIFKYNWFIFYVEYFMFISCLFYLFNFFFVFQMQTNRKMTDVSHGRKLKLSALSLPLSVEANHWFWVRQHLPRVSVCHDWEMASGDQQLPSVCWGDDHHTRWCGLSSRHPRRLMAHSGGWFRSWPRCRPDGDSPVFSGGVGE